MNPMPITDREHPSVLDGYKCSRVYEFRQPLSVQKVNNILKLEVSFELPSLVAPLSRQVDGIVGQTNTLLDPSFYEDHSNAIY